MFTNSAERSKPGAFYMNPGFSYVDAGHEQSDIDIDGYQDGKGIIGLLGYSSGSNLSNALAGVQTNAAFIPIPDGGTYNIDSFNAGLNAQIPIGVVDSSGGVVRLTVSTSAQIHL